MGDPYGACEVVPDERSLLTCCQANFAGLAGVRLRVV